eukprot:symbB.v1.2.002275.t1/scaffold122.1/size316190/8
MENFFARPATPWRFTASTESISPPTVLAFRQVKVTSCFSEISTRKLSWLGLGGAFCFRQRKRHRVSVARRFRVFGISDVHTDWPENWEYLRQLPVGPFSNDALLLAGDVSHDMQQVLETLQLLKERFRHVFFVPGNHDLYVSGEKENMDSMEKHQRLLDECARLQVWTQPVHFQEEKLLIVPLFSWYHPEFDHEPDLPLASWPSRRHSRLALLGDEMECQWKDSRIPSGASLAAARNKCLAQLFDAMNDDAKVLQLGEDSSSVPEQVISMSHFLPQPFLLPEKRFLFFPQLAQAAGSLYLQKRVAHLKPQIHLFGHTHFAWDQRHQEVRYVSAPLGSPKEWRSRPRSMRLEGGVPTLLWRGRGSIDCAPRAALWSDYYEKYIQFLFEVLLTAMATMADTPRELKVNTIEGAVLTVQVMPTNTIQELKAMLCEKKHENPVERRIFKAEVLFDGSLVHCDSQTLQAVGLLDGEFEVTVVYSRNEVEAATKAEIHGEGFVQVNLPVSLVEISSKAFENCRQLVKVAIPESVTCIGVRAFAGCRSLGNITIPDSVAVIGARAFAECRSLASITIPGFVRAIGPAAFARCSSLVSVTIPESVTAIETCAFEGCTSLVRITIPQSVTAIGAAAFARCVSLVSITIPESVAAIEAYTFEGCKSLVSVAIPESVTDFGPGAFALCGSLVSINIPESVTAIGSGAFAGCTSLVSITIPESVTAIGEGAFKGCTKLRLERGGVCDAG